MNERIEKLAEQAWQWANNQVDIPKPQIIRFEEKFAELIVRECVSALDEADGSVHHRECLFDHFGVEDQKPCKSPYCECDVGKCSHPGFYDARGEE